MFDNLGRYLIYDGLQYCVKAQPGLINTLMTMGLYYGTYLAYNANPYIASTLYVWGGVSGLVTLFNTAAYMDKGLTVSRIYLLQNRTVVRFETGRGVYEDVPLSGIKFKSYN